MKPRLLIIDGNSILYRSFYSTFHQSKTLLTNAHGQPINAVLIFNKTIDKYLNAYQPQSVLVAFDKGKTTFRHKLFDDYKQNRSKTPAELISQIPIAKKMLELMNIKYFELENIEADDIVASLAFQNQNKFDVLVVSSDKDLQQLINKNIKVIVPQNGFKKDKVVDLNTFFDENGFQPQQIIDYKTLVGDSSDNIPGIPKIGKKTATNLIKKYSTVENIYNNLDSLTKTIQKSLKDNKDKAMLYKKIITLLFDIQFDFNIEDLEYNAYFSTELIDFFKSYGLASLVKKYQQKQLKKVVKEFHKLSF